MGILLLAGLGGGYALLATRSPAMRAAPERLATPRAAAARETADSPPAPAPAQAAGRAVAADQQSGPKVMIVRSAEPDGRTLGPGFSASLPVSVNLARAVAARTAVAGLAGNGRDRLAVAITNRTSRPLRTWLQGGQICESNRGRVIVARTKVFVVPPRGTIKDEVVTAALSVRNTVGPVPCALTARCDARLDALIAYLGRHPEVPRGAVQTAVLALTENLPLSAFARFRTVGVDVPTKLDTDRFRVDTADIVQALQVLRDLGVAEGRLALTVDPQLLVEAMIDPLAHAAALRYFKIPEQAEWRYWKNQLLSGDTATRHYGLFGIARHYPQVALDMMPQWAREQRTNEVFRKAAIEALGETDRAEAVVLLRHLAFEFGHESDLGRTAAETVKSLEGRLGRPFAPVVPFRFMPPDLLPEGVVRQEVAAG